MNTTVAVEKSSNSKTGEVSVTYTSQASCPKTCPLYHNGCYAETGMVGIHTAKLNKTKEKNPDRLADNEAKALSKLSGTRPLRLHVVGDTTTNYGARTLYNASKRFPSTWTYTHAWSIVSRTSWGQISVLASVENDEQMKKAHKRGYAFAVIVDQHQSPKAYKRNGFNIIPCPAQTKKNVTCLDCKLCWKDKWLHSSKTGIAFEAHGNRIKKVKELVQITL